MINKGSSETIRDKIAHQNEDCVYNLRSKTNGDLTVPAKTRLNSQGFSYSAAKLYNKLPINIREAREPVFKALVKKWIWEHIPSR